MDVAGLVEVFDSNGDLKETSAAPGYFRITLGDDGTVAMLWIFDVYERHDQVRLNKKRVKTQLTERTDFRMGGPYDNGDFARGEFVTSDNRTITGTARGSFSFVHFERDGDPLFLDLTNGSQVFTLDITLTPR